MVVIEKFFWLIAILVYGSAAIILSVFIAIGKLLAPCTLFLTSLFLPPSNWGSRDI